MHLLRAIALVILPLHSRRSHTCTHANTGCDPNCHRLCIQASCHSTMSRFEELETSTTTDCGLLKQPDNQKSASLRVLYCVASGGWFRQDASPRSYPELTIPIRHS
jgi:hypothetical protein